MSAAIALSLGLVFGCNGSSSESESQDKGIVQLVYQDWRTEWFPVMAQKMLEDFHTSHPNIRVFYTPDPANFFERVLLNFQSGAAADVFEGCCTHFPTWAQEGYILDLRPFVAKDLEQETVDEWDKAQYEALFTQDGRQFGLPKYHGALALYFNKDLFDEYGVDYPDDTWNYDDYRIAMERLTHDRDDDGMTDLWGSMIDVSWDRIQVHVNAWGGAFVDPDDPARIRMCEPEALAAMEWLRARMWDDGIMATSLDVQDISTRQAFITGQVAMVEDGSWALKDILSMADFRVGVAPMPQGPVRRVTLSTTDGFGIYANTKHPEEAWELVKFLVGEEYGRAMAKANFLQPARSSLLDEWVDFIQDEFPGKIGKPDLLIFAEGHVKGYSVVAESAKNMSDANRLAQAAWDKIFTLGQAPIELMETVCRQIQEAQ